MSHSGLAALLAAATLAGAGAGALLPRAAMLLPRANQEPAATAATPTPAAPTRRRRPGPSHRRMPTGRHLLCSGGLAVASAVLVWRLHTATTLATLAAWLTVLYSGALLAAVDITVRRLPTPVITAAAGIVLATLAAEAALTGDGRQLATAAAAGAALATGYLLLALLLGSGIGLGDVRLAALLGLALGTLGWNAALLGSILPYLLAAPTALIRLHRGGDTSIAFGPYLVGGALAALLLTT